MHIALKRIQGSADSWAFSHSFEVQSRGRRIRTLFFDRTGENLGYVFVTLIGSDVAPISSASSSTMKRWSFVFQQNDGSHGSQHVQVLYFSRGKIHFQLYQLRPVSSYASSVVATLTERSIAARNATLPPPRPRKTSQGGARRASWSHFGSKVVPQRSENPSGLRFAALI